MILVDSSVWIDFLRGRPTRQVETLDSLLGNTTLAVGDLIKVEVLQGVRGSREFNQVRKMLDAFTRIDLAGQEIAVQAAKNFRTLRDLGVTVRKTIDTIIATRCIESGYSLLHSDHDFEPFATHLGLKVVDSEL